MPEWAPGVLAALLADIERRGRANQRRGLLLIAAAVEANAKAKLTQRTHRAGTQSPAGKGQPPALVTGTGRRSIGHEYIASLIEPVVKVGTIANIYPPTRTATGGRTPSSKYLLYQEKLPRFQHPFLLPAYHEVVAGQVKYWLESFRDWPRI